MALLNKMPPLLLLILNHSPLKLLYKPKPALGTIKRLIFNQRISICNEEGASADAGSHYQKLYGRVTDVCGNRRGQPKLSAMQEPHSGGNSFVIKLSSPSGKYALATFTFLPDATI